MLQRLAVALVGTAIMAAACGGGGKTTIYAPGILDDAEDGAADDAGLMPEELPLPDDVALPDAEDVFPELEAGDVELFVEEPGSFGWPCESDADCLSGYCIETAEGKFCSAICSGGGCGEGWTCLMLPSTCPDCVFICVPDTGQLCRPCNEDSECWSYGDSAESYCVAYGDAGHFCGIPCDFEALPGDEGSCPEGYDCGDVVTVDEELVAQCVKVPGEQCECNDYWIETGAATTCFATNEYGVCEGERLCGPEGLTDCDSPAPEKEACDGLDNNCDGLVDEGTGGEECVQENEFGSCPGVFACLDGELSCQGESPFPEYCNGKDDDCDGETDEDGSNGCTEYYADGDGDGFGLVDQVACLCQKPGPEEPLATLVGDCDDTDPEVSPSNPEQCDGIDNNCDEFVDEFFADTDEDGTADCVDGDDDDDGIVDALDNCPLMPNPGQEDLDLNGIGDACDGDKDGDGDPDVSDCAPLDPQIHQGAPEKCNAKDDDCDGILDEAGAEGCLTFFIDQDADSWGQEEESSCLCSPSYPFTATATGDCDDGNPAVNPSGLELCNGKDDDCDGILDPKGTLGCISYFEDVDLDGFGGTTSFCLCQQEENMATNGGDCDDLAPAIFPGAPEACNGGDDNCNGFTDEGYPDKDGDFVADCVDPDLDGDGFDNEIDNCPYVANEGQADSDGDGTGDVCDQDKDGDGDPDASDCAPDDPAIHHDADELCNGEDDDCDGEQDEEGANDCQDFLLDKDGDGWGVEEDSACLCTGSYPYVATLPGDCDDDDAAVKPQGLELCNGIDDDCDGEIDPEGTLGCSPFYEDGDEDGYGGAVSHCLCGAEPGTTPVGGDCDDEDGETHPGAPEACDGKDNNCNTLTDEGFKDTDGDGLMDCVDEDVDGDGVPNSADNCVGVKNPLQEDADDDGVGDACDQDSDGDGDPDVSDCAPLDPDINSEAEEFCNGKDDDCDGLIDPVGAEGCVTYFMDVDGDGFGLSQVPSCLCEPSYPNTATSAGDCNDLNAAVHPEAEEVCNGMDDDCDGAADPANSVNCKAYYADMDMDGYGNPDLFACLCGPDLNFKVLVGSDCDDDNPVAHPGAVEICDDDDNNCDGVIDEASAAGCLPYYEDKDADGFGDPAAVQCLCGPNEQYGTITGGDCDDNNPVVNPTSDEVCDEADNDCDGNVDELGAEGCLPYYLDQDGDSWGADDSHCLCHPEAPYTATMAGDCGDADPLVNPGAEEVCFDGIDNDCNPTAGCYTLNGEPYTPVSQNKDVSSHFKYGNPYGSSANTGWEKKNTTIFYLYEDPAGNLSLIVIHDKPQDGSGGSAHLSVSGAPGAGIILYDDPSHSCDTKTWNSAAGSGNLDWCWGSCCTDGVIIGYLPDQFCMDLQLYNMSGISKAQIRHADGSYTTLPSVTTPFQLCSGE